METQKPGIYSVLQGVTALSSDNVWAVGSYLDTDYTTKTLIEHWDGTSWSIVPSPNKSGAINNLLFGITAVSANDIWAVGYADSPTLVEHWDGTNWSIVDSGIGTNEQSASLYGVDAIASDNIWAVGQYYDTSSNFKILIKHWNGSSWSQLTTPSPSGTGVATSELLAISADASDDVWAVGEYLQGTDIAPLVMHYDGTNWTIQTSGVGSLDNQGGVYGVLALSDNNVWVAGTSLSHYDGTNWTSYASPDNNTTSGSTKYVAGMTALSSADVWGVGDYASSGGGGSYIANFTPKTPLILIPGVMGSKLAVTGSGTINDIDREYSLNNDPDASCFTTSLFPWSYVQGDLIWIDEEPLDFLTKILPRSGIPCSNYLDVLQYDSSGEPVYSQVTINGQITDNPYNNVTIPYIVQQGYTPGIDFYIYPYDWRKDVTTAVSGLDAVVNTALSTADATQAAMLTHSMGGLVAREYIQNVTRASKVQTLVELADPHVGTPKFLAQLLYNTCPGTVEKDIPLAGKQAACFLNPQEATKLIQNFPGAFDLLPSKKYYDLYPNLYPYSDTQQHSGTFGALNYSQLKNLLDTYYHKNMTVFSTAEATHDDLDSTYANALPNGTIYYIAGSGYPTFGQIFDNILTTPEVDAQTINGDDTVPLLSATLNQTSNVYYTKQTHGDLPTGAGLAMAVNLLNGNTTLPSGVQTTPFAVDGTVIKVHSPTLLDVYDDQNNHTGSSSAGFIEEGIPGSSYDQLGSMKMIYVPSGGNYHLATRPISAGSFTLEVINYTNNQPTQRLIYQNVQQTAQTTSSMSLTNNNTTLSIDTNGDGIIDETLLPTYTLTGSDAADYAAPVTSVALSPAPDGSGNYADPTTVTLTATASAGFSVANTYYKIDNGSQQTYSSPFTVTGSGEHTIIYWSTDSAGLVETQNTKTFTIATSTPAVPANWWNASWGARRKITFNNSGTASNLVNFPVLVKLDSSRIDYTKTQGSGQDLRFVDADGSTVLSYEIENWNSSGTSDIWVKIPQIDAGSTTDYIWMYYDNPSAGSGQDAANVWDSNFKGVYHMKGTSDSATIPNSAASGSSYNGTKQTGSGAGAPANTTSGEIGDAQNFTPPTYIEIPGLMGTPQNVTLSAWANLNSADSSGAEIISLGDNVLLRLDRSDGNTGGNYYYGSLWAKTLYPHLYAGQGWHYFAYTEDAANHTQKLYVDGTPVATTAYTNPFTYGTGGLNTEIGRHGHNLTDMDFNGKIDEVRVSTNARSGDWIKAEYKTDNDTMNTFGNEDSIAPAAWIAVNDNTLGTNYTGQFQYQSQTHNWNYVTNIASEYMHDEHNCGYTDCTADFRFNGTKVRIYGKTLYRHGIFAVSIDGGSETMVDEYFPTQVSQSLLYTSPVLASGNHTLHFRVTGNANANATLWNGTYWDNIDYVEYLP